MCPGPQVYSVSLPAALPILILQLLRQGDAAGRLGCAVHGNRPHRHAAGAAVLLPRRNPRVRAAAAACARREALTGLLDPSRVRPMNLETSMRCPALVCNRRCATP